MNDLTREEVRGETGRDRTLLHDTKRKPLGGVAVMPGSGADFEKTPSAFKEKRESIVSDMSYDEPVTQVSHIDESMPATRGKPLPSRPDNDQS